MKAYVLIPFLLRGLVTASPQSGSGLQACGDAFYHPSSYTCYESNFLCPIIDGEPTLKCGDSCYLPNMYSCTDGRLGSMQGLAPICPNLAVKDHGCIRYVKGFDITGVVTEVDLAFPQIKTRCECIQACLDNPTTCANYVWKFATAKDVASGHRACVLYSDFNLPANVTIEFDLQSTNNSNIIASKIIKNGNNPHAGGAVPQAFMDANLDTVPDDEAVSGPVWQLSNGDVLC